MTMDTKRLLLYFALFMVSMTLWQHWLADNQQNTAPTAPKSHVDKPKADQLAPALGIQSPPLSLVKHRAFTKTVTLKSNTLELDVALHDGSIIGANLPQYPKSLASNEPFSLLSAAPNQLYIAESGVRGFGTNGQPLVYRLISRGAGVKDGRQRLVLEANLTSGVRTQKIIELQDNSYLVKVTQRVINESEHALTGRVYTQLVRQPLETSHGLFGVSSYAGAAVSLPPDTLYEKISYDKIKKNELYKSVKAGWVAIQQPYFISAWIPEKETNSVIYSQYQSNGDDSPLYTIGRKTTALEVKPNTEIRIHSALYSGPVITENLKHIAPGLELTIDYGIFWWLATPIFYLLKSLHDALGNWGWAIVMVTLLIKLIFIQLSAKSYRSMARMRQLQPKMEALRERYKDNKEKLTKATMELYAKEKVNPFGGCLPIVVQIPVFISLYWVLIESVELRQAPWILWIQDLSARDPYYILPLLMGATMLVQQLLSPPPSDPTQKQLMMLMPVGFTFLFATFPAGLVLYWTVNNAVSILQQWIITKRVGA